MDQGHGRAGFAPLGRGGSFAQAINRFGTGCGFAGDQLGRTLLRFRLVENYRQGDEPRQAPRLR